MVSCEIVTIGDEILIGQIIDTNSAYIGQKFNDIGVPILSITSIKDDKVAIFEQLTHSFQRSHIVIVTGGLGPTKDDITKSVLTKMFDCEMVRDENTYNHVEAMVKSRGFAFNESNKAQANVPRCAKVIKNDHGTAPGMMFERGGHLMFCLPGVPFEMENLLEKVIDIIKVRFELKAVVHKTMLVYGLPESVLSETICDWESALPDCLHLAYLPNAKGIKLRLSAYDVDRDVTLAEIDKQFDSLKRIIPANILGFMPMSLEEAVGELLIENCKTMALAESCTGGAIAQRVTAMAGCSRFFNGGVVAYSNDVKVNVLGVKKTDIEQQGAVSEIVVKQMAEGIRRITGSDIGVATSGIAGPDGGSDEKPVGTVWFAVAHSGGVESCKMQFGKLRQNNIDRATSHALDMVRKVLLKG